MCRLANPAFWLFLAALPAFADETELPATKPVPAIVSGRVIDELGHPIENAEVHLRSFVEGRDVEKTDRNGRFRISLPTEQPTAVIVTAPGMATESQTVDGGDVLFRLRPSPGLMIRVVDERGAPIRGVAVTGDDWRDAALLIRLKTDADGRAEWPGAPTDAVEYMVMKDGYEFLVNHLLTADGGTHEIVLRSELQIAGRVADSASGEPIERFRVIPVQQFRAGQRSVQRRGAEEGRGGRFEISFNRGDVEHCVRIEADGYRPVVSEAYRLGDMPAKLKLELEPAPPITGIVRDASGNPVSGTTVLLATASQTADLRRPRGEQNLWARSGDDGRFRLPASNEAYAVVAMHELGYGDVRRNVEQDAGEIALQPWASLEGTLSQNGRPVADYSIFLSPIDRRDLSEPDVELRLTTSTDDEGRFHFERVPPGRYSVTANFSIWRTTALTASQSIPLALQPGESRAVTLGGGSRLTGHVSLGDDALEATDLSHSLVYLLAMRPGVEPPKSAAAADFDWQAGWDWAWVGTQEGAGYLDALHHHVMKLSSDGRFEAEGLAAGDYRLAIRCYEPPEHGCLVVPIAARTIPFRVDGPNDLVDLGKVDLRPIAAVRVGEGLPDLKFEDATGLSHRLHDQNDKVILVHLWASWCAYCGHEMPMIRRLHADLANDGRIGLLGLSLDGDVERANEFISSHALEWPQGYLGDWEESPLPTRLGVRSIPCYLVIGRDGRLLHKSADFDAASEVLQAAAKAAN